MIEPEHPAENDAGLRYPWVVSSDGGSWAITSTNGDVIASEIPHGVLADYIADLHNTHVIPPGDRAPRSYAEQRALLDDSLRNIPPAERCRACREGVPAEIAPCTCPFPPVDGGTNE